MGGRFVNTALVVDLIILSWILFRNQLECESRVRSRPDSNELKRTSSPRKFRFRHWAYSLEEYCQPSTISALVVFFCIRAIVPRLTIGRLVSEVITGSNITIHIERYAEASPAGSYRSFRFPNFRVGKLSSPKTSTARRWHAATRTATMAAAATNQHCS